MSIRSKSSTQKSETFHDGKTPQQFNSSTVLHKALNAALKFSSLAAACVMCGACIIGFINFGQSGVMSAVSATVLAIIFCVLTPLAMASMTKNNIRGQKFLMLMMLAWGFKLVISVMIGYLLVRFFAPIINVFALTLAAEVLVFVAVEVIILLRVNIPIDMDLRVNKSSN